MKQIDNIESLPDIDLSLKRADLLRSIKNRVDEFGSELYLTWKEYDLLYKSDVDSLLEQGIVIRQAQNEKDLALKQLEQLNMKLQRIDGLDKFSVDNINHPDHYTWHKVAECKEIVQEFNYNLGTAIAYIWRCEKKGSKIEDLRKAIKHLQFEIDREVQDDEELYSNVRNEVRKGKENIRD